ncbi:MAG TPA: MBL fold metallo-hydrolase [Actinomycetes bacterium]|nr:MBL fold metallo-hydrolase [Actinomycetes bacterium]
MRLTVLGSCGTYVDAGRACSGYLLEAPEAGPRPARVWVDAGSGSLANLMRHAGLDTLDAIWLSHLHIDHCTDLPVAYFALRYGDVGRSRPLPVYGPPGWAEHMAAFLTSDTFNGPPSMADRFDLRELRDGQRVRVGALTLTAVATQHSVETYGVRASAGGVTIGYSADSGPCDALGRLAADADLFVCEAAWLERPQGAEPIHCSPAEAGTWASRAGARRLVLTHLRPGTDEAASLDRARAAFDRPVRVAREGDSYDLGSGT